MTLNIKERPVLVSLLALSLLVDAVLIMLVYNEIGGERLPKQLPRLIFQIICILLILYKKSNKALFILTAYHIISGILFFLKFYPEAIDKAFGLYHIIIGVLIYFHDWFENKLHITLKYCRKKYNKL